MTLKMSENVLKSPQIDTKHPSKMLIQLKFEIDFIKNILKIQ